MSKRAIIYTRVSSEEQGTGYSLTSQEDACRAYADRNDLQVVAVRSDEISGATLDRPGLQSARDALQSGAAEALIVFSSDRLARSLLLSLLLRDEIRRAGAELHYAMRGQAEDTPEGNLVADIEAVFSQFEKAQIAERVRRGRRKKASAGWVGAGKAPYGYGRVGIRHDARLVICESEAAVVRRIYDLYCHQRVRLREICRLLTDEGVPTPRGARSQGEWFPNTIAHILKNGIYHGRLSYDGVVCYDTGLAIVDEQLWAIAGERFKRNRDLAARNRKYHYLLSGYFRCACGSTMAGRRGHETEAAHYLCTTRYTSRLKRSRTCQEHGVRSEDADAAVWDWLRQLISSADSLRAGLRAMRQSTLAQSEPRQKRISDLTQSVERATRRIRRLMSEFADSDGPNADDLRAEIKRITEERAGGERELATLLKLEAGTELDAASEVALLEMMADVRDGLATASYELKREILDRLDLRVQLRADTQGRWLDVTCGIPGVRGGLVPDIASQSILCIV